MKEYNNYNYKAVLASTFYIYIITYMKRNGVQELG